MGVVVLELPLYVSGRVVVLELSVSGSCICYYSQCLYNKNCLWEEVRLLMNLTNYYGTFSVKISPIAHPMKSIVFQKFGKVRGKVIPNIHRNIASLTKSFYQN